MSKVSIWEAVALSLYIDPDSVKRQEEPERPIYTYPIDGFTHPVFEEGKLFNRRVTFVCANRWRIEGELKPNSILVSPHAGISLDKFVDFALSEAKWPIPDELQAIREAMRREDELSLELSDAVSEAKPRIGGRKPIYAWDEMDGEILRYADLHGLPDTQAHLVRHLLNWFERHYGKQPADSAVKERVSRWYHLRDAVMAMEAKKPEIAVA